MAGLIPQAVANLFVKDTDTSRVRDSITSALNPVLAFLTSNFTQDGPALTTLKGIVTPALQVLGKLKVGGLNVDGDLGVTGKSTLSTTNVNGAMAVTGTTTLATTNVNGSMTHWVPTNASTVFVPAAAGNTLYATNVGNTVATFAVKDTGAVYAKGGLAADDVISAPSFVSTAGFKAVVSLGTYYNTNTAGGQNLRTVDVILSSNANQLAYIYRRWAAPRSGSITAISVVMNNSVNANVGWQIEKNGAIIAQCIVPANKTTATVTINKGALPFVANDIFSCIINMPAGINFAGRIDMEVELGA